jgi:hypothetical protein
MHTENSLQWIASAGGPLLLLEEHLLSYWRGFNLPKNNPEFVTDYDRACEIDDYIGIIGIDSGYGLVLGDDPCETAWFQFPEIQNGLLVRWIFAENEPAVIDALNNLQEADWQKTGVKMHLSNGKLILFDSACEGTNLDEKLQIEISKGWYEVETLLYEPNKQTSLILHRFFQLLSVDKDSVS